MSVLSAPYMDDEAAAFAHVEAMLWLARFAPGAA